MNVPVELMVKLQHALGAPGDVKAEGLVRLATERLECPREYHLEVLECVDGEAQWTFHSFHETAADAQQLRAKLRNNFNRQYRIVELIRRVLP